MDDLAVDLGLDHLQHLAAAIGLEDVRAELVAEPQRVADRLDRFDVEIGAGQIALGGVLVDEAKRHLAVGVAQEGGRDMPDLAGLPVGPEDMDHQHGVGRVGLRAEAVVGQGEERAVTQVLDARQSLHRLALEREVYARAARGGLVGQRRDARHAFRRIDAQSVRAGEAAGDLQFGRRVGRGRDQRHRRQDGVAFEGRREFLLREGSRREAEGDRRGSDKQRQRAY